MNELDRALRTLAERGEPRGAGEVFERAGDGPTIGERSRAGVLVAGAIVVVAALVAAVALGEVNEPEQRVIAEVPPADPVFDALTDTVLLFDDGYYGVVALDLDTGRFVERTIDGQGPGDQPYRLHRTGDRLVVGAYENWTAPLDDGPSEKLGDATVFVPAAEPGSVWLVDYPGRFVGDGIPTLSRMSLDGALLEGPFDAPDDDSLPIRGVYGGMAYETPSGIIVRDATGAEVAQLGVGIGDAQGSLVAWCGSLPCRAVILGDMEAGVVRSFEALDAGRDVNVGAIRFSPDGSKLAVQVGPDIMLIDLDDLWLRPDPERERRTMVEVNLPDTGFLGWSDDGTQLFWSRRSYGEQETIVGRYDVLTGTSEQHTIDTGGFLSFVAVPRDAVPNLLAPDRDRRVDATEP